MINADDVSVITHQTKDFFREYHVVVQSVQEREQQLNNKYPSFVVVLMERLDNEILMK